MKTNRELAKEIVSNARSDSDPSDLYDNLCLDFESALDHKDKQAAILVEALEEECEIAKTVILKACLLLGREATATISDKGFCYGERWQNATTNYERIRQKARLTLAKYKEGMKEYGK